jgi:diguanylate cyclase (GGDEF)-like protein/PAS domain S-box-containing protein
MSNDELGETDYTLHELEKTYHMSLDNFSNPIFLSNLEGRYLYVNQAFAEEVGKSVENIIGKFIRDIITNEEADKFYKALKYVFQSKEEKTIELYIPQADAAKYFGTSIMPFKDSHGKVICVICSLTDITMYKQTVTALLKSEEKRRALQSALLHFGIVLSSMNTSILLISDDNRIEFVNQALCDLYGCKDSPADLIGLTLEEVYEKSKNVYDDFSKPRRQEIINLGQLVKNEEITIGGRTCLRNYIPLSLNGKSYGHFWHYVDITERKQIEEDFKEREQFLLVSQKVARIGSYLLDLKTGTWKCSPELNKIFGIDESYLYTMEGWFGVIHPDWREEIFDYFSNVETEKSQFDYEYKIVRNNDGTERWVHGLGDLEFDDQGNPIRLIGTIQDITKRKKTEEEIIYLSYHDKLTGLYNRRFYEEEVKRVDNERNLPISIIIGDVNGLKLVNDAFGHHKGDELILKAAVAIQSACRVNDIVARWGGDEFVILLPQTKMEEAEKIVDRIKELYSNEHVNALSVSISFGWETKTKISEDIIKVLKSAEDKMYENKIIEKEINRGETISKIIHALHQRQPREEHHSIKVSEICRKIGKAIHLSEDEVVRLGVAGFLHDIGKITIEDNLLNKPGKLTNQEWHEIKRHSDIGYRILSSSYDMFDLADWVFAHHERWDGKGYPKGLKGEDIPKMSRIITLADAYDAMTSAYTYGKIMNEDDVVLEIRKNAGKQFDPIIARVFVEKILKKSWN